MNYELHPLCTLFPRMAGADFEALKADIKANGLRTPIVIHEGMILDGGNRYRACLEIGIEPSTTAFSGGNLVAFVISSNLHRRHLSPGQQAAIVASAQDWGTAHDGSGANQYTDGRGDNVISPLSTAKSRATQSGASVPTQRLADRVAKADPELSKKVAHGEITLPQAVKQVEAKKKSKGGLQPPPKLDTTTQERMHREDTSSVYRGCLGLLMALESLNDAKDWELEALRSVYAKISDFI